MSTLYELTEQYQMLLEMAQDADTDPEALRDTFEALDGEIEAKADGYAMVMRELEAQEAAIKTEVDRLNARRLTISNNARCLKLILQNAMQVTGKPKFKTTLFSYTIQKNPPSVVMDELDVKNIPEDYLKYKDPDIDKKKILADIKAGKDLSGIAHVEQSESLRIR